jgi:DNA-binding MarR family transcriptional regulator
MFECCIYFNLTTLTRQITKLWQEDMGRLGLSPSHGYLLIALVENPQISQKDAGKLMELDASTITRFIETLEQRGLVEKSAKGKGGSLKVTVEGKKLSRQISKTIDGLYGRMQAHFGAKEFERFVSDLYNARQSFNEDLP